MQTLLFAALIAACVAGGFVVVPKMLRGKTWVRVDGTVKGCVAASIPVKRKSFVSGIRLSYSYWADDTFHDESLVEIGVDDEKNVDALVKEFPQGSVIRVRYNSDQPEESMIDPADNPKIAELAGMAYTSIDDGGPLFPLDS